MMRAKFVILFATFFLGTALIRNSATAGVRRHVPNAQGNEEFAALPSGAPLSAELESSLDSKKARVGDQVLAHTTEALKANGKTLLPKNAKLLGHVTQAFARSKGDPSSALAIQFDKAVIKKGQEIPLRVVIQALAAAPRTTAEATPDLNSMPTGTAAAQGSPMGGSHGTPGGGSPNSGIPLNPASAASDAGNDGIPLSNSGGLDNAGHLKSKSQGVFGLEGLHLATDEASADQSSLITTSGKSVHLDGGIRILLRSR